MGSSGGSINCVGQDEMLEAKRDWWLRDGARKQE